MKKKIISLALVVAMVAIMLTSFTLAYFTDQDNATNVFTVGELDIELQETAKVELPKIDKDGKVTETEEQSEKMVPNSDEENADGSHDGYQYVNLVPGNEITKTPKIKNVGENTAYVRVAVVMNNLHEINNAIDEVYENLDPVYDAAAIQAVYDDVFEGWGINYAKDPTNKHYNRLWMTKPENVLAIDTVAEYKGDKTWWNIDNANAFQTAVDVATAETDGTTYTAGSYYDKAIVPGERIYVYYLELAKGAEFVPFTGLNVPEDFDANRAIAGESHAAVDGKIDQMAMFEGLTINIYVDAIQKDGFADWKAAFTQLEKDHPLGSDFYRTYEDIL